MSRPTRIYIDRKADAANRLDGGQRPVWVVDCPLRGKQRAHGVAIAGEARFVNPADAQPLADGAHIWVEVIGTVVAL